jgi:formylglycine-generating enzyme required for sulfatase activity
MLQTGELLFKDRYRIVRAIKRGGMGAVYEAHDETLRRRVAVKETVADTEKLRAALEREALLLARLRHAHLPRVFDHFSGEHGHFLVMDFVDGDDLGEIVSQKVLSVERVLRWAHQLLNVVEYLHLHRDGEKTKAVIHCDIKPFNLKLTDGDDIVLLDFGLASGLPTEVAGSHLRTQYGGTPVYAAPEQYPSMRLETDAPNPKWDIYAIGATLYHLFTGFEPTPAMRRTIDINKKRPDPLETAHKKNAKKIPLALSKVIAKAMALDADDRYATIGELRAALRAAESAPSPAIVVPQLLPSFRNSIGMEFVLVPAGKFQMGSNASDTEKPIHEVTIGSPFYMGKYPVTQGEWFGVMGENPSHFTGDDRLPVERVSWDDCQGFIKRLNAKNDGYLYRLPSEAEWEYACRAGTEGNYSGELGEIAWYAENSVGKTHLVGKKKPNIWGLYDMCGNVYEWCQCAWHDSYDGAPIDGSAWEQDLHKARILRGGAWASRARFCRSANRDDRAPDVRTEYNGFRVVATKIVNNSA